MHVTAVTVTISFLAYDSIRNNFMVELENLLGGRFGEFSTLDNFNKASFI